MQNMHNPQDLNNTNNNSDTPNTNTKDELINTLYNILQQNFSGSINIIDNSHLHVGHNHGGGKHYTLHIVDEKFSDLNRVQRHRIIYEILGQYMQGKIHALALKLYSPYEYFNEQ